jgi:phage FluMu protein Com
MAHSCPECGASIEFEEREVRLRTGTCPSCAKEFAFVEGTTVSSRLGTPPPGATAAEGELEEGEVSAEGPECEECGSPLSVRAGEAGSLEVTCPECETTAVFVPKRGPATYGKGRERPTRLDTEAPRGSPCRKCGAPLRFSTNDEGLVVGECDSCGNRFTLPPRRGGGEGPRGYRSGAAFDRRGFRPGPGGQPYYRGRGRDGGGRPFRRAEGRGPPRYDDEDRRRRRRRRDE